MNAKCLTSFESSLHFFFQTINSNHLKHYHYLAKLLNFNSIEDLSIKLKLLFRASEHNFSGPKFHEICDGMEPTLTIVRFTSQMIFGGYASKTWFKENGKETAPGSFLFSLDKETRHDIYDKKEMVLNGYPEWGPFFSFDLKIRNNCNANIDSKSDFGYTYSLPKGISYDSDQAKTYLADSYNFQVEEYEVFSCDLIPDE